MIEENLYIESEPVLSQTIQMNKNYSHAEVDESRYTSQNVFKGVNSRWVNALKTFNGFVTSIDSRDLAICRRKALDIFAEVYPLEVPYLLNIFEYNYPHWFKRITKMNILSEKELILLYLERQHRYGGYDYNPGKKIEFPKKKTELTLVDEDYVKRCSFHKHNEVVQRYGVCRNCSRKLERAGLLDYLKENGIDEKLKLFLLDTSRISNIIKKKKYGLLVKD